MAAMNSFAHDLPHAVLVHVEALGQTESHIQEAVVHALHADADGPAILLAARLRVAGHGDALGFICGSVTEVSGRLWVHRGFVASEVSCLMFCAGANMSSSANCKS